MRISPLYTIVAIAFPIFLFVAFQGTSKESALIASDQQIGAHSEISSSETLSGNTSATSPATETDFIKEAFDMLPESHKESVGYIFVTSANLDIRGRDIPAEEYFQKIYFYGSGELQMVDLGNTETFDKLYKNAKKYVNIIAERKLERFSVGFTTKTYANNPKKADIYLSSEYLSDVLFLHEFGHVMDYRYGYTDTSAYIYPYRKRENSITEYGAFHIGEDFAEAYRFYVLHSRAFREMTKDNKEIKEKYEYLKKYVFGGIEYPRTETGDTNNNEY